jgi:hypothetical protein
MERQSGPWVTSYPQSGVGACRTRTSGWRRAGYYLPGEGPSNWGANLGTGLCYHRRILNTCIYCPAKNSRRADAREHWIPRWLGTFQGADTLLDRLCISCNKRLGDEVDTPSSRTGPEAIERYRHQIKGRRGTVPNPFRYKGQSATPPTAATATLPGFETPLLVEDVPGRGRPDPRALPQIIVRDSLGKQHAVPLPDGLEDETAGPWLQKALEQRGLAGGKLEVLICEKAETVVGEVHRGGELPIGIRRMLLHVFANPGEFKHYTPDGGPSSTTRLEIKLEIGVAYARALAKLAFHYALKQLPWLDGHDRAFMPIKQFILDGKGDPNEHMDFSAPTFLLGAVGEPVADGHFLLLNVKRESISALLKTFVRSPYSHDAVRVELGLTPSTVLRFPVLGHHLRLFAGGPQHGHDGELVRLKTRYFRDRWGVVVPPSRIVPGA